MTVSLNWIKKYIDVELDAKALGELLTEIGLEVEDQSDVVSPKGGLEGLVVGQVVECARHPNADKLKVTKVNVGGEVLPVVCGAPNVAMGQKVVVARPGTRLFPTGGDPFLIKKAKIRGEVSEGMLCSEVEIGIGTANDGILVLDDETRVGIEVAEIFKVERDTIYKIGLTPNRSDATNHIGVARDLAAALKINHGGNGVVNWPSIVGFEVDELSLPISVKVEDIGLVPRYTGVTIRGLKVMDSPQWLKKQLEVIGVKSINNIVDVTNYILHELGQPLHAFDYDKISQKKVQVHRLEAGVSFEALDNRTILLDGLETMICDGDDKGMCIGGIYGGHHSGVKADTVNMFLESAHFEAKSIRRTGFAHDLRTDAERVYEKGSDPNICLYALKRAVLLIQEVAGGVVASEVIDIYPNPIFPKEIEVSFKYIEKLIGADIGTEKIVEILEALDMEVVSKDDNSVKVKVPTNKADVLRPADIAEEVLRIYGLNNVPIPEKISTSLVHQDGKDVGRLQNLVADYLSDNGLFEMMALSLSQSKYFENPFFDVKTDQLIRVNNTSSTHLDVMRPSMLPGMMEAVQRNFNRQAESVNLFEFGKIYGRTSLEGFSYREDERLSIGVSGRRNKESWLEDSKRRQSDIFVLKALVDAVMNRLGILRYQVTEIVGESGFDYGVRYHSGKKVWVEWGSVVKELKDAFDVKQDVFYADFRWSSLVSKTKDDLKIEPLNPNPSVRRDIALTVNEEVTYDEIEKIAKGVGKSKLKEVNLFDVYRNTEKLGKDLKSYSISFVFEEFGKNMKEKDVDKMVNTLIMKFEKQLGATIRR